MRTERALLGKLDERIEKLREELQEAEIARAVLAKMMASDADADKPIDAEVTITQAIAKTLQRTGPVRTREIIEYLAEYYGREVQDATVRSILSGNAQFVNDDGLWRIEKKAMRRVVKRIKSPVSRS